LWWSCITGGYKCIAIQQPSATLPPRGSRWRSRCATDAAYAIPSVTPWPRHPKRQSVSRPIISGDTRMPANRPQSLETYPVSPVSWGISSISMAQAVKADRVPGDTTLHQRPERFLRFCRRRAPSKCRGVFTSCRWSDAPSARYRAWTPFRTLVSGTSSTVRDTSSSTTPAPLFDGMSLPVSLRPCRRLTSTTNLPFDTCRVAQILDAISSNRGPIRIHTQETPERVDQLPIWDKIVSDSWTGFLGTLPVLTQSAGISKRHRRPSLSKARSTAPPSSKGITSRTTHVP